MHLQNAETINRLVEQGELLLKTIDVEREKDLPRGPMARLWQCRQAEAHKTTLT